MGGRQGWREPCPRRRRRERRSGVYDLVPTNASSFPGFCRPAARILTRTAASVAGPAFTREDSLCYGCKEILQPDIALRRAAAGVRNETGNFWSHHQMRVIILVEGKPRSAHRGRVW